MRCHSDAKMIRERPDSPEARVVTFAARGVHLVVFMRHAHVHFEDASWWDRRKSQSRMRSGLETVRLSCLCHLSLAVRRAVASCAWYVSSEPRGCGMASLYSWERLDHE